MTFMASQLKDTLWRLGDFNYPKFSWNHEHVPSMKYELSFSTIYEDFIILLDDKVLNKSGPPLNPLSNRVSISVYPYRKSALRKVYHGSLDRARN